MRRTQKFISVILALMMVLSIIPITASAEAISGTYGNNFTWSFDDSTGTLTISGEGAMPDSERPWQSYKSTIETVVIESGITAIGKYTFYEYPNIVSVAIPDTVTTIGDGAFFKCAKLKDVTIPESVTTIGISSFYGLAIENLIIPDSVTSIGHTAFYYCSSLKTVKFSANLKTIEHSMFGRCSSLESVVIPNGVTSIGSSAFQLCENLKSIEIPATVSSIGACAFSNTALEEVVIPEKYAEKVEVGTPLRLTLGTYGGIIPHKFDGKVTYLRGVVEGTADSYYRVAYCEFDPESYGVSPGTSARAKLLLGKQSLWKFIFEP